MQAGKRIYLFPNNFLRRFRRDGFNFNAAFRARDNHWRGWGSIEQNRKIDFARNFRRLSYEHFVHDTTSRSGLVRDENLADEIAGDCGDFLRRLDQFNTAGLAATAGMNLRFHDEVIGFERPGRGFSFLGRRSDDAPLGRDAEAGQDFLGLIFVNVQGG